MSFEFLRKKEFVWVIVLAVVFAALRLPAVHHPYHQDEYKWVLYSHPEIIEPGTVPHPPLTEFIYARTLGPLFGDDNFRFIPLIFGAVNLFLLFYLAKMVANTKTAFWTASLFTVSFFSVLASTMVDVDGAVMPMFFLIMYIGYFRLKRTNFQFSSSDFQGWFWVVAVIFGAIGGFLIKVSGILPIVALGIDFAIEKGVFKDKKRLIKYAGLGLVGAIALGAILFLSKYIFPFFNLEYSFNYWKHFANSSGFFGRGWLQTFIQFAKAMLYTSPLLLIPVFFADKEIFKRARPFFLFVIIGLLFYLFAFDFSIGALDRYLQFLIIPLCVISGAVFAKLALPTMKTKGWWPIAVSVMISLMIFFVQFFNHYTPPLYPKTEWLSRVGSLQWNFLFPFTGGSGPLPFYISFGFMALVWIYVGVFAAASLFKTGFRKHAATVILVLGLLYNTVFIEEYLFGKINGNAAVLVKEATAFIANNPDITKVTVYNDNGGFNIMQTDKYRKRLYIDPKFDIEEKIKTLNTYKEFYLVVDIPHIDPNTIYAKYFSSCLRVYDQKSGQISAFIYDCQNVPDVKI